MSPETVNEYRSADSGDYLDGFFANHSLFKSTDPRETAQRCSKVLGPHQMQMHRVNSGLNSSFNGVVCGDFAIVRLCHGSPVTIEPESTNAYLVQQIISGTARVQNGDTTVNMKPGVIAVASPNRFTRTEMDANSVNVVVRLERKKVEDYIQSLLQRTIKEPVIFSTQMGPHSAAAISWMNAVQHVCDQYETLSRARNVNARFDGILAEYMVSLLLQTQPHNYSACLLDGPTKPSPQYVKKALDYIHDNICEPISIVGLARYTGVSARTLQTSFKRYCGMSPLEYIRDKRIESVHRELATAGPETRVTEVFTKYGIHDFGRYAYFFKRRYGYLPSEMLRISRST